MNREITEKNKLHVPSQFLLQLATSIENLITKHVSGDFDQSVKPSSNSGRRKAVPGAPGPLVDHGIGDRSDPGRAGRAQVRASGSHTEQLCGSQEKAFCPRKC